jgi:hypothetical protein
MRSLRKAIFSMAFIVSVTLLFSGSQAAIAAHDPIIFADGVMVFTDKAGFNEAAGEVCEDIDKVWFKSSEGDIGPGTTIFGQTHEGVGVTFTSTSVFTGTNGHSDAQGPFTDVKLTPTNPDCGFTVLSFDLTRGADSYGKDITLTLSNGDTVTETLGHPSNLFFGIIAPNKITSAQINSDGLLKSIQQVRVCDDGCEDVITPEPGATTTIALGAVALVGLLVRGGRRMKANPRIS